MLHLPTTDLHETRFYREVFGEGRVGFPIDLATQKINSGGYEHRYWLPGSSRAGFQRAPNHRTAGRRAPMALQWPASSAPLSDSQTMLEINPIRTRIEDMQQRSETLRGYL